MYIDDTIAAIATPPGIGGVGIIRVSGKDSFPIVNSLFKSVGTVPLMDRQNRTIQYGTIVDPATNKTIDEVLVLLMKDEQVEIPDLQELDAYIVGLGEETEEEVLKLSISLRQQGYSVDRDFFGRKAKPQFKNAQKYGAKVVITLGEEELASRQVPLKVMSTGKEVKVDLADVYEDFDSLFRQATMDTTAIDEYFGK